MKPHNNSNAEREKIPRVRQHLVGTKAITKRKNPEWEGLKKSGRNGSVVLISG